MSINQEFMTPIEKEYDILLRKFDIEESRLNNELILESNFEYDDLQAFFESEDGKKSSVKKSSFSETMHKLSVKISQFITDVIQMFANMFSNKSHLDLKAYLDTAEGSIQMQNDLIKVEAQAREEVRKGRKLIQAIANKTNIDDAKVEEYVDRATNGINNYGTTIVKTSASYLMFQNATGGLNNLKNEMKDALKTCMAQAEDPNQRIQISKIYNAMCKWSKEATNVYKMFGNKIQQEAEKQAAKKNNK